MSAPTLGLERLKWKLSDYNRKSRLLKPFTRAEPLPVRPEHVEALAATAGITVEAMQAELDDQARWPIFKNGDAFNDYQVQVRWGEASEEVAGTTGEGGFPEVVWLSIKRIDKGAARDWRHFQEIKNMIVGPEHEGVELFPAESRLTDTANQYHLWVLRSPTLRFPFGFETRVLQNDAVVGNSRQRPRVRR
jgi:hypothetical protein